jgi:hypothetical protein
VLAAMILLIDPLLVHIHILTARLLLLLPLALQTSVAEVLAAMIPCAWLYGFMGCRSLFLCCVEL